MGNLTEIKNHKVVYDGKDGKLILPLNFGAIKEMVPWMENSSDHNQNRLKGSSGFPYIFLTNTQSYVILDTGSKMPTLYSGKYQLFTENSYNTQSPHKLLAHKKEISELLKLKFTPKQRIKFNMPYTREELIGFSDKSQFAKAVFNLIEEGNTNLQKNIDKLDNFLGDKVFLKDDQIYGGTSEEFEEIEFTDSGVELYTPEGLYKEKYLDIDEDSDWAFDSAIKNWSDCEEMESDELQYIDNHFTPQTNEKFIDMVNTYEPKFWEDEGIDSTSQLNIFKTEGVYDMFLTKYFEKEWENGSWEVLEAMGCALWRARQASVKDEIENEITYEMELYGHDRMRGEDTFLTKITYPQLLQLIGSLDINNFSELREWELNQIGYNLTDSWYDAWDVDDEGMADINYTMMSILNKLDEKYGDRYGEAKQNEVEFKKLMEDLKFKFNTNRWGTYPNQWRIDILTPEGKNMRKVVLNDFNAIDNTVTIHTLSGDDTISRVKDFKVAGIADEVTNLKIPFPEEETKN